MDHPRYHAQFQVSPIPTFVWRRHGDDFLFEETNLAGAGLGGQATSSFYGRTASDVYQERPDILEAIHRSWNERRTVRIETTWRLTATQRLATLRLDLVPLEPDHLLIYVEDLSAQRDAEARLRESEQRYRAVIEGAFDGVVVVNANGRIEEANPRASELFGYPAGEAVGANIQHFLSVETQIADPLNLAMPGLERGLVHERTFARRDGSPITVEMSVRSLGDGRIVAFLRDVTSRRAQTEALRRNEEQYRRMIELSPDAILVHTGGRIVYANEAMIRLVGASHQDDVVGKAALHFLHPDFVSPVETRIRELMEDHRDTPAMPQKFVRLDGTVVDVEVAGLALEYEGRPSVQVIARDITARILQQEAVRRSEALLATVLDRLPIGVLIADTAGTIVRSNPSADEIWRFHRNQLAFFEPRQYRAWWTESGKPIGPTDWASTRALLTGEMSLNELIDIETEDGSRKTILNSAVPLRDDQGTISGVVILNQDVTAQRETSRQIENLAARMRQLISATADGICTIDREGVVTLVNPAAAEMLGREDLLGTDLHTIVHPGTGRENLFAAVMESRTPEPLVSDTFVRSNGLSFEVEMSCSPIVVDDEVLGAVIAFRDVTRRNALERELDRTTRLSSLGQLAATIAHEFNNVMMGIMPFMEVIIRRADSDDSLRMMATHVNQALSRAKQITLGILKFARNPEPALVPTTLGTLLDASLAEARAIAGQVALRLDNHGAALAIRVDRVQFQQVLSNLVSNARDAMAGSGTVVIETRQAHPEEISRLGLPEDVEFARISVIDQGCGMDARTMEMMFEPMFTLKKAGGTGLGLAVVQQIVNKHGGIISVDSEPEGGTAFHLFFPLCDPPPASTELPVLRGGRNVRRLLLVEDDPNVAAGLAAVLETEGIEVRIVTHGRAAPAEVESFQPDAVVIDRGLPDIDGIEVARMLATRWPSLPMVFSTGHGGRQDLEGMLQKPNIGYLLKPYAVDTLLDLLDRVSATPAR